MRNTALLLIDFQNDYFPGFKEARWPLAGAAAAAKQAAKLLSGFRANGFPIVHVRHENTTNDAPLFLPESKGAQIHPSVAPIDGEPVVVKRQANSFRDTNLKKILDDLGVENLVIAGAMSNMCIDAVTRAAADFGFNCSVAHDACAAMELEIDGVTVPAGQVHAAFMAALGFGYAKVASADELLSFSL